MGITCSTNCQNTIFICNFAGCLLRYDVKQFGRYLLSSMQMSTRLQGVTSHKTAFRNLNISHIQGSRVRLIRRWKQSSKTKLFRFPSEDGPHDSRSGQLFSESVLRIVNQVGIQVCRQIGKQIDSCWMQRESEIIFDYWSIYPGIFWRNWYNYGNFCLKAEYRTGKFHNQN